MTEPRGGTISGQASVINTFGWTAELMGVKHKAGLSINWPGGGGFSFDGEEDDNDGDGAGTATERWARSEYDTNDMGGDPQRARAGGGQRNRAAAGGAQTTPSDGGATEINVVFDKAIKYGKSHTDTDLAMEAMQPYIKWSAFQCSSTPAGPSRFETS